MSAVKTCPSQLASRSSVLSAPNLPSTAPRGSNNLRQDQMIALALNSLENPSPTSQAAKVAERESQGFEICALRIFRTGRLIGGII